MTGLALNCKIPDALQVRPQELPLPRPDEGLPDLAVRPARSARTAGSRSRVDGETPPHASASPASTWKRTPRASLHRTGGDGGSRSASIDVNRAGVPLMEIVCEPDIALARGGARLPA